MPRTRLTDRISKTASIMERLDKIATELEHVDPRVALALDQVSDRLERGYKFLAAASEKGDLKLHEILRFKEKFTPADIQALQEKLLTRPNKAKNLELLISHKIKPTIELQKAVLAETPYIIQSIEKAMDIAPEVWESLAEHPEPLFFIENLSKVPESAWTYFWKGINKHPVVLKMHKLPKYFVGKLFENENLSIFPRALQYVPDHSTIPASALASFGKVLEKDPRALQYLNKQYQSKLPASAWESFGKGLVKEPDALKYVEDQSLLPASAWESFGKSFEDENNPQALEALQYVKDQSKLPDSAWVSYGKGMEKRPGWGYPSQVKEKFRHKIPGYSKMKDPEQWPTTKEAADLDWVGYYLK